MCRFVARAFAVAGCSLAVVTGAHAGAATPASNQWLSWGNCEPGKSSVDFELRRDFNNFDTFACPTPGNLFQGQGAQVSATFDELAKQTSASVDGVAAVLFRHYFTGGTGLPGDVSLTGLAIGPFVQGDGTEFTESATSPSHFTETITAGGVGQVGISNIFGWGEDNFRVRGGETDAPSAAIVSNTFVGEWIPYYDFSRPNVALSPIIFRFIPELMFQYDSLVSGPNKYILFADHSYAFRVGPQAQLRIWAHAEPNSFLSKLLLTLTYHASDETYTGRLFSWAQAIVSYNLTDNIALSASYGYGNSEITANNTNQVKLGLAAKF
jgi:hypothetical protein